MGCELGKVLNATEVTLPTTNRKPFTMERIHDKIMPSHSLETLNLQFPHNISIEEKLKISFIFLPFTK